jgi:hypothetical protein
VDDLPGVRGGQRVGDLPPEVERLLQRQPIGGSAQDLGQILSVEELHDQEELSVALAAVEDRGDARVLQRGGHLRLTVEPSDEAWVIAEFRGQELHGDGAAEPEVDGAPHLAHRTPAQQ